MSHRTIAVALAFAAVLGLTGCGKNPSAIPAPEKKINARAYAAKTDVPVAKVPALTASNSAKATTTKVPAPAATPAKASAAAVTPAAAKPATPAVPAAPVPPAVVAAPADGGIKLGINLSGNAAVSSLGLKVFDQIDPGKSFEAPLTIADGKATWSQQEIPAGKYTVQVRALGADGTLLGLGSTEALVKGGQLSDVALDLRVNMAVAEGAGGTSSVKSDPAAGQGGILGMNVEVI